MMICNDHVSHPARSSCRFDTCRAASAQYEARNAEQSFQVYQRSAAFSAAKPPPISAVSNCEPIGLGHVLISDVHHMYAVGRPTRYSPPVAGPCRMYIYLPQRGQCALV